MDRQRFARDIYYVCLGLKIYISILFTQSVNGADTIKCQQHFETMKARFIVDVVDCNCSTNTRACDNVACFLLLFFPVSRGWFIHICIISVFHGEEVEFRFALFRCRLPLPRFGTSHTANTEAPVRMKEFTFSHFQQVNFIKLNTISKRGNECGISVARQSPFTACNIITFYYLFVCRIMEVMRP